MPLTTAKSFVHTVVSSTGVETLCTAPSDKDAIIRLLQVANISSVTPCTVTIWAGGTTDDYLILNGQYLEVGEKVVESSPVVIQADTSLYLQASEANVLVATAYGAEVIA